MGVRRNFYSGGEQNRHFAYPFQVADDAMQMDVHETLHPFYITKKCPVLRQLPQKMRFVGSIASFSLMLLFTQYETTWLTAISSHCLQKRSQPKNLGEAKKMGGPKCLILGK